MLYLGDMETTTIHGHIVKYDPSENPNHLDSAIRYLSNLSFDKAEELFKEAKNSSEMCAKFENSNGSHFKLKLGSNSYTLVYRGY